MRVGKVSSLMTSRRDDPRGKLGVHMEESRLVSHLVGQVERTIGHTNARIKGVEPAGAECLQQPR